MTVAVVVDSTADIPAQLREQYEITVVPLLILFGKEQYRDGIDMSNEEFYRRLIEGRVHPTTSQPSPADFAESYEKLGAEHEGIISIHLGGKLSGTVRAAQQAADMLPDLPIKVIDSGSVSMGLGFLGIEAAKMAQAGQKLDDIVAAVEGLIPRLRLWAVLDTLTYLVRGGRIGRGSAFVGNLLNVKPMIYVRGEVLPGERVRTHKKAITRLVELASDDAPFLDLAVLHSRSEAYANELADQLGSVFPRDQLVVAELTGVIGVHGGPGIVGITGITRS